MRRRRPKHFWFVFDLTSAEKMEKVTTASTHQVFLNLQRRYNRKELAAWPSVEKIMKDTGLTRRTVERALCELQQIGVIERRRYLNREHGSVVVWDIPGRTDAETAMVNKDVDHKVVHRHFMDRMRRINQPTADAVDQGNLGRLVKVYAEEYSYAYVYTAVNVWLARAGTSDHEEWRRPDLVFEQWLRQEGDAAMRSIGWW